MLVGGRLSAKCLYLSDFACFRVFLDLFWSILDLLG